MVIQETVSSPLTDEMCAKIVLEDGPYSQAEIKTWHPETANVYFKVMKHNLLDQGRTGFRAMQPRLREMTQLHLLSGNDTGNDSGIGASSDLRRHAKQRTQK